MKWVRYPKDEDHEFDPLAPWESTGELVNCSPDDDGAFPIDVNGTGDVKRYSTDPAAAFEMEERLQKLGVVRRYAWILKALTVSDAIERLGSRNNLCYADVWWTLHATPEQRCRAALSLLNSKSR